MNYFYSFANILTSLVMGRKVKMFNNYYLSDFPEIFVNQWTAGLICIHLVNFFEQLLDIFC